MALPSFIDFKREHCNVHDTDGEALADALRHSRYAELGLQAEALERIGIRTSATRRGIILQLGGLLEKNTPTFRRCDFNEGTLTRHDSETMFSGDRTDEKSALQVLGKACLQRIQDWLRRDSRQEDTSRTIKFSDVKQAEESIAGCFTRVLQTGIVHDVIRQSALTFSATVGDQDHTNAYITKFSTELISDLALAGDESTEQVREKLRNARAARLEKRQHIQGETSDGDWNRAEQLQIECRIIQILISWITT